MAKWRKVGSLGVLGLDDEDNQGYYEGAEMYYGAAQEYDTGATQEYDGYGAAPRYERRPGGGTLPNRGGRLTSPYPVPVRGAPAFGLPPELARKLAQVPGEVFDIYPGVPNTGISTALSTNTSRSQSAVHTFTPPTGHFIILNPGDVTQEALFIPYDSRGSASSNFILGLIEIFTRTGLQGRQERVYAASSTFHRDDSNISSVGHRRKWQLGYIISPGDTLITYLTSQSSISTTASSEVIGTTSSVLDHRVMSKKITP